MDSRKAQDYPLDGIEPDDDKSPQSPSGMCADETSETTVNTTSTPAPKILYRYIVKDVEGTITHKDESDQPIQYEEPKILITAPAKQTILEVVTTRTSHPTQTAHIMRTSINTRLKIHSSHLINALRELIPYYPQLGLMTKETIEILSPYQPLVHYMDALKNYKTSQPKSHDFEMVVITNDHIDTLLELLNYLIDDEIKVERERHLRKPPVCTWNYSWMLFPPGTFVWVQNPNEDPKAAIVTSLRDFRSPGGVGGFHPQDIGAPQAKGARLNTWIIEYNSDMHLDGMNDICSVDYFEGEKEISSLNVCPKKWSTVTPKIIEEQMRRGKMYAELFKPCYMEYSGQVADGGELQLSLIYHVNSAN
jgi:hypothetical protein